ncbi:MAG: hypothetical protein JW955_23795 [Sedimentisphaerales bacterium]|nr:hypothetical protein [Sedimentisphaerales bacterium]
MSVIQFLRAGGLFYTVGLAAKWVYRKIRGCFPEPRLRVRRSGRTKGKSRSDCVWRPVPSRW